MFVNLAVLGNLNVLFAALALTLAAVIGKVVSGFVAGKGADWKIVGIGMVPRGEVGLIFAAIGRQMGVINDEAFAVVVMMIILNNVCDACCSSVGGWEVPLRQGYGGQGGGR
jgi:Kef-type K+ transport system membrane component KefB